MNEIRAAIPDDLTAVCALLAEHELVYTDLGAANMDAFVVVPTHDHPGDVSAVAGVETFWDDAGEGLLRSVAVRASLRGRGIGANLVADFLIFFRRIRPLFSHFLLRPTRVDPLGG